MAEANNSNVSSFGLLVYRIVFSLVMVYGVTVNKKLYITIKNQILGERGKVFQQIMKSYAVIQAFGWPFITFWMFGTGVLLQNFGKLFSPCVYVSFVHVGIFAYMFLRAYVGFNSLVLAVGRYVFVVHDKHVMKWGVETVANVLIRSSFIIPFFMAVLANSVVTFEYNGWMSQIQEYASSCYSKDIVNGRSDIGNGTANKLFKSPLYNLLHSNFPTWLTSGLNLLFIVLAVTLFSNVCEGIIYAKCAIFVYRYFCIFEI